MFISPSRKLFYDKNQYQPPKQLTAVLAYGEDEKGRFGRSLDGTSQALACCEDVVLSSAMNNSPLEPRLSLGRGFCCKSAVLELLDSFSDQLVKLLRLRGERLHLVLSELRLKRHNLLEILCLGDLFDQRES